MPTAATLIVCSERVLQHFLPLSLSTQDSRSNKLQASDKRHSSQVSSWQGCGPPHQFLLACTRHLTYLLNHFNSHSSFLSWARHLWYARKIVSGSSANSPSVEIEIKVLCVCLNVRWEAVEFDKRQTMHSGCHGLLNKDGLQATASAGYVSRRSLPNYLHQLSSKPVFSTAAWGGARPAGEIRKDFFDSRRHFELKRTEAYSVLGFDRHRGHEVFIALGTNSNWAGQHLINQCGWKENNYADRRWPWLITPPIW